MEKLTILLFVTAMVTVNAAKRYNDNTPGTSEVHVSIQEDGKKPITHTARGDNLDISTSYQSVNKGENSNGGNNGDFQPENNQGYGGNYGSNGNFQPTSNPRPNQGYDGNYGSNGNYQPSITPQQTPDYGINNGNLKPTGKPPHRGNTNHYYTKIDTTVSVKGENNHVIVNNRNFGQH